VNGKKVNIPSYRCKEGDVIEVREKSRTMALVLEALESPERDIPEYISVDPKGMKATFTRTPSFDEVPYAVQMEPNLVVEFYYALMRTQKCSSQFERPKEGISKPRCARVFHRCRSIVLLADT